jgi:hypothetical protein
MNTRFLATVFQKPILTTPSALRLIHKLER